MFELIQLSEHDYYIDCPSRVGIVKLDENDICLIDSGLDKEYGKKIMRIVNANGWRVKCILSTHSHADHIGANKYIRDMTGCTVYANGIEAAFAVNTLLEPSFIYGGYPCKELRGKFFVAEECPTEPLTPEVLPNGFEMIPLPGHFFDMVAFRTPDGNVFLADALASEATLDKYVCPFLYDVEKYILTLEMIKSLDAKMFVPSHAQPTNDIKELAQYNIDKTKEFARELTDICSEPICFDGIIGRLFTAHSLPLNLAQYSLVGSTVRSYLSYLKDKGMISVYPENNMLLWCKNSEQNGI